MKITAIEPQKKKRRKNIFLDGEFGFGLSDENIIRFGLRIGDELTKEFIEEIRYTEEFSGAKRIALRSLARIMKTEQEIRRKLASFQFADSVIEKTIAFLAEHNFLNDEKYGELFVNDATQRKLLGKKLVFYQLQAKGIPKALAQQSVAKIDVESERRNAILLGQKKMALLTSSQKKLTIEQVRRRTGDFLLRRGFSSEIVFSVLKKLFS
ncbi:MAG: RecX family transcriptional regulator [Bacteroidota bacterium]